MITQDIYQKTIAFAGEAHKNQLVPGTQSNYLLHLSNVAMEVIFAYTHHQDFNLSFAIQLALLHDVIEDTEITYEQIEKKFDKKNCCRCTGPHKKCKITKK